MADEIDRIVQHFCCDPNTAHYGPYRPVGAPGHLLRGTTLLPGRLRSYRLIEAEGRRRAVNLQVYLGISGLAGELWEKEVRVLIRAGCLGLPALPEVLGGGFQDHGAVSAAGVAADGAAFIATVGSETTLDGDEALAYMRSDRIHALRQFSALAESLAALHGLGLCHRNLWPGTVEVDLDADEDTNGRHAAHLRFTGFEMSMLIENLFRSAPPGGGASVDLQSMYLDQRGEHSAAARALLYSPPERIRFLFPAADVRSDFQDEKSDVYSLAAMVWEWFLGSLTVLGVPEPARREPSEMEAWSAEVCRLARERLDRTDDIPDVLAALLSRMLSPRQADRPSAAEVVDSLGRLYEAAVSFWQPEAASRPRLVAFMPRQSDETIKYWGWISHSAQTPQGLIELREYIVRDLRSAVLYHAPEGAFPFLRGKEKEEKLRSACHVLVGQSAVWFCDVMRRATAFGALGPRLDDVLLIKYVADRAEPLVRDKLAVLTESQRKRRIGAIDAVPYNLPAGELDAERVGRPSWIPALDAVRSSDRTYDPEESDYRDAVESVLRYEGVVLRARRYAYVCHEGGRPGGTVTLELDRERDLRELRRDPVLAKFAGSEQRRPRMGDFFDAETGRGDDKVLLVPDDRGRPGSYSYNGRVTAEFVERTGPDRLTVLTSNDPDAPPVPSSGWIQVAADQGTNTAINRQVEAVSELFANKLLVSQLRHPWSFRLLPGKWEHAGEVLDGPSEDVSGPRAHGSPGKTESDGRQAVLDMLTLLPFYALQGPPGTGKTEVAAQAIAEFLRMTPEARVLVSAQSNHALDNLGARVLRLLGALDADGILIPDGWSGVPLRVSSVSGTAPDPVMRQWSSGNLTTHRAALIRRRLAEAERAAGPFGDIVDRWAALLDTDGENALGDLEERLQRSANLVFATCATATAANVTPGGAKSGFDWIVVEEAAKASVTELTVPLTRGTRWTLIGDHRQLSAFRRAELARFLQDCANDPDPNVASLHEREASILGALDLFASLFKEIEQPSARQATVGRTAPLRVLRKQYRMRDPIAQVISRVFYPTSPSLESDGLPPGGLRTGREVPPAKLTTPSWLAGRSLVWLNTEHVSSCHDRPHWSNYGEAAIVARLVDELDLDLHLGADGQIGDELAVLSPYQEQLKQLRNLGVDDRLLHSVHEFQGREADVAVVSLVRHTAPPVQTGQDPEAAARRGGYGYVADRELVNVLFSRARGLLVVVGNHAHFAAYDDPDDPFWPQVCRAVELYGDVLDARDLGFGGAS